MRSSAEVSIDLSTEDLLQDPSAAVQVEIEDVGALTGANPLSKQTHGPAAAASDDDSIEIELTAEQIDALLSGSSVL